MRDKEGPVCSVQRQTEPVASFVPQKPFHHKARSPILLLLPFPPPPPTLAPPQKEPAWPPTYTIQAQCHSESSTRSSPFSCLHSHIYFFCFPSVTCQYNVVLEGAVLLHLNMWMHRWHRRWEGLTICVYSTFFWEHELILKKCSYGILIHGDQTQTGAKTSISPLTSETLIKIIQ